MEDFVNGCFCLVISMCAQPRFRLFLIGSDAGPRCLQAPLLGIGRGEASFVLLLRSKVTTLFLAFPSFAKEYKRLFCNALIMCEKPFCDGALVDGQEE